MHEAMTESATYDDVAHRIGARLARDALWSGDRCNWTGPSMEVFGGQWTVVHRALGADLYAGTSGIALYFAHLHARAPARLYEKVARAALATALARTGGDAGPGAASVYSGQLGVGFAALRVGLLLGDEALVRAGQQRLRAGAAILPGADGLDVIAGSAGAIPVLLGAAVALADESLREAAVRHGEHLLAHGRASGDGEPTLTWDTLPGFSAQPLTGYAHGAAGIACALLELAVATGERRFRDAAEAGFRYERRCYVPEQENWPDFRTHEGAAAPGPVCGVAWCHGAPGIGLSRLRAHAVFGDDVYREEARAAIRTTARALDAALGAGLGDLSLCHGGAGNADLLLAAAELLDDDAAAGVVARLAADATTRHHLEGLRWPCGIPGANEEAPGLMLGLAGIGYFFLRLADPHAVPSVLAIGVDLAAPATAVRAAGVVGG